MPDLSDPRIAAVVAVAPVGALFGDGAFAGAEAPAQIHRLEGDRVLREPWHAENILRLMSDNASLVAHPQAHHFAFISPFPASLIDQVGAPGRDPAGFDRRAFLAGPPGHVLPGPPSARRSESEIEWHTRPGHQRGLGRGAENRFSAAACAPSARDLQHRLSARKIRAGPLRGGQSSPPPRRGHGITGPGLHFRVPVIEFHHEKSPVLAPQGASL